jgi:hypothetical protein
MDITSGTVTAYPSATHEFVPNLMLVRAVHVVKQQCCLISIRENKKMAAIGSAS